MRGKASCLLQIEARRRRAPDCRHSAEHHFCLRLSTGAAKGVVHVGPEHRMERGLPQELGQEGGKLQVGPGTKVLGAIGLAKWHR